jgi:AcrR family transcriptional regulator
MGSAFTEKEKNTIRMALKDAARQCAATIGMRKTTVDQLAESAGISKGAFYKFYETKEHLFFEILEDWHTDVYSAALETWKSHPEMSDPERTAETILVGIRSLDENFWVGFFENDMPYLLRKIPEETLERHYHSDDVHVREFIEKTGIRLKQPLDIASAVMRGLLLLSSHRTQIGKDYPAVYRLLILGACEQMIR